MLNAWLNTCIISVPLTKRALILNGGVLILFCFFNDALDLNHPLWYSLHDNITHGIIGLIVLMPFMGRYTLKHIVVVFVLTAVLDLDHFVFSGSLSVGDALALSMRPFTHSFTFIAVLVMVLAVLKVRGRIIWIVFAALTSHLLRDSIDGYTYLFYPLEYSWFPYTGYIVMEVVLLVFSYGLARNSQSDDDVVMKLND